jgi:HTH-type transcriptional regulator/antitoxin HigA
MARMSKMIQEIRPHWAAIRPYLSIHNEQDYDRAVEQLNQLIDEVGANEEHPCMSLWTRWAQSFIPMKKSTISCLEQVA